MKQLKEVPSEVLSAEVIFVSHSGGKDSQAMLALLKRLGLLSKCVIVHADLGDMEWEEMKPWIESTSFGLSVNVVSSDLDFFSMARKYGRLPSGRQQFCTDFLKCQPIEAFIHSYMTEHGLTRAINATGMRAEESKRRAGYSEIQKSDMYRARKYPSHLIIDWLPILSYRLDDVLKEIEHVGQVIHHVYSLGFSRLSCVFCINGRIGEHQLAAKMRPELYNKMVQLEIDLGKTLRVKQVNKVKVQKYLTEYITN